MPLKEVLTYEFKQPYYLRFTCEKCGCRTHWIPGKIISTEVAERKGQQISMPKQHSDTA